jgi:hypothetical protein
MVDLWQPHFLSFRAQCNGAKNLTYLLYIKQPEMINYLLFQVIQLIREYVRFFLTSAIATARLNDKWR